MGSEADPWRVSEKDRRSVRHKIAGGRASERITTHEEPLLDRSEREIRSEKLAERPTAQSTGVGKDLNPVGVGQ